MTEETLIPEIISGSETAFRELYDLYAPKAYRTALLITGSIQNAEDTVQETFIKCCGSLDRLKNPCAFSSYFYRTLTRTAWRLSAESRKCLPLEDNFLSDIAVHNESYRELYDAVAALDVKLRTVVVLFYFNDLPISKIAEITSCFEGTVKSRLNRARKELSKKLKKEDYYG